MSFFTQTKDGTYATTLANIQKAFKYFAAHPDACIMTGIWSSTTWNRIQFMEWFRGRLDRKINRALPQRGKRKLDPDYQTNLRRDANIINDYYGRRIRRTGCNYPLNARTQTALSHD